MKNLKLRTLTLFTLLAALLLPAVAADAQQRTRDARQRTIGQISDDGKQVQLQMKKLNRKMGDGLEASGFAVMQRGEDFVLLRVGDDDGRSVVESVALERSGLLLRVVPELKWITTCSAGECEGFCVPDGDHCDCHGGGGLDEALIEDVAGSGDILQPSGSIGGAHGGSATGGCTFGTRGGGLYDVVILG